VQGVREPMAVYRPLTHKGMQTKGRGVEGLASVLVGRDEETQALQAAVETVLGGMGGIVTVVGEAGIGKSRLVAEVKLWALGNGNEVAWLEGRCLSYATNVAYHLWLDMLRQWLNIAAETQPDNTAEVLRVKVQEVCPDLIGEVYPFLARLLSLPLDEASAARIRGIDAGGMQVLTHRAFETLLASISQQHPLVLVCEDLHWADSTSVALLEHLLPLTDRISLLLVCVMRPVTEHSCWQIKEIAAREYRHRYTDVWLDTLSTSESGELIGNLLNIEELPCELRDRILERAEGNPFFLEEILRSLIEDEAIMYESTPDPSTGLETRHWVVTGEIDDLSIPDTLHGVLTARIDRLEPGARRVLQLASVIGRTFSFGLLAAISESGETGKLDTNLVTLQRAQLIREKARLPEREYIFKHVLTQEAAYNGLLKRERRTIHRQVVESIEKLYPERIEEQLGLLAYHWEQAGDTEQAVIYLRKAGEQAAAQYANAEAVDYFSRALALVKEEGAALRYDLLLSREKVNDLLGKRELQAQDLEILSKLAERLDKKNPQPGKSRQAEVGMRRIHLAIRTGEYMEAGEKAREIVRLAQTAQDIYAEASAYREWGRSLRYEEKFTDAQVKIAQALAIAKDANLNEIIFDSLHSLITCYIPVGDYYRAAVAGEQALKICRDIGDRNREGIALRDLSFAFHQQQNYVKSLSYAEESLRVCRETGNRRGEGWAFLSIGRCHLLQPLGKYEEIENCANQALIILREVGDMAGIENAYSLLILSAGNQNDDVKAINYAQQALNTYRQLGHRQYETSILNTIGYYLRKQGQYTESQRYNEKALYISREIAFQTGNGVALVNMGHIFSDLGDYETAKIYLENSLSIANELNISHLICECLVALGFISLALTDCEQAYQYGHQALTIANENDNIAMQGQASFLLGHVYVCLDKWDEAWIAYNQYITLTKQTLFWNINVYKTRPIEAKTGLARLALIRADPIKALKFVEEILEYVDEEPGLPYNYQPLRIYLTCIQVLQANQDPRAEKVLEQAYNLIQERAATIEDEDLHRSYLENVPENREIVALWERRSDVME
jgi:predicted ATPase